MGKTQPAKFKYRAYVIGHGGIRTYRIVDEVQSFLNKTITLDDIYGKEHHTVYYAVPHECKLKVVDDKTNKDVFTISLARLANETRQIDDVYVSFNSTRFEGKSNLGVIYFDEEFTGCLTEDTTLLFDKRPTPEDFMACFESYLGDKSCVMLGQKKNDVMFGVGMYVSCGDRTAESFTIRDDKGKVLKHFKAHILTKKKPKQLKNKTTEQNDNNQNQPS